MKRYIIIILMAGLFITACDRDDFQDLDLPSAEYKYVGMASQNIPNSKQVFEGTGVATASIDIPLLYDLGEISNDVDITFTVSGDGQLGRDFNVPNAKSVSGSTFVITLPADTVGTSFTIVPVTNETQQPNVTFNLEITSTPEGVFAGAPLSKFETLTILDDDCPYDFDMFVGTASVIENGSVGPYLVNSIEIAPNTVLIDNFWDSGIEATFIFVPCDGTVQIPAQSTPAFGDPDGNIVGSGTWNDETGEVIIDVTINFPAFDFTSQENHVYSF